MPSRALCSRVISHGWEVKDEPLAGCTTGGGLVLLSRSARHPPIERTTMTEISRARLRHAVTIEQRHGVRGPHPERSYRWACRCGLAGRWTRQYDTAEHGARRHEHDERLAAVDRDMDRRTLFRDPEPGAPWPLVALLGSVAVAGLLGLVYTCIWLAVALGHAFGVQ